MTTYVFDTDQGEVRIRARSHSRAEQELLRRGYVIHSSRTAYESELLSVYGGGGLMAGDGFGGLTIDAEGDIGIGIGGGLTLDSSGDIGVGVGGFDVDITDNDSASSEPAPSYDSGSSYDSGGGASDFGSGGGDFGGGDF